uniref:ENTH domain-containing protein n=1 Tax=Rhizophora mucronata TaxID=61149 RepID=A0A2P2N8E7_RHIMU
MLKNISINMKFYNWEIVDQVLLILRFII